MQLSTVTFSKEMLWMGEASITAKLRHVFLGIDVLILPCKSAIFRTLYILLWKFPIPSDLNIVKAPYPEFPEICNRETFRSHIRVESHKESGEYEKAGGMKAGKLQGNLRPGTCIAFLMHCGEAKRSGSRQ